MIASKTFILEYEYVPDILEQRGPYREDHLALAKKLVDDGVVVYGGPFNPPSGAMFVFKCDDKKPVEAFVNADSYVKAGLVPSHSIRELTIGIGSI
jgi:uncharacterized protein